MNANLSKCASELSQLMEELECADEECDAFHAPSECFSLFVSQLDRDYKQILAKYGFTRRSFREAVIEQTSEKYFHFAPFYDSASDE